MLSIFDLEPLDSQIDALSDSQAILAEPSILRWLEYVQLDLIQITIFECLLAKCCY
ncbi:conserved hypothetical protein [Vibrio nigripulchritudo SO65]|nr:conserved hypothetical protein [Vibrio nigripulchritudo AM115]CCN43546.1 conserved hypothetical protein [Vibrio nigripulchritudo FTn2]CCN64716.1 conserved hypothetical protein [Vibrio nigripulchritudo POn4]CCN78765.1 conserved hypothetical protein [Vibrio nigripulchritudo SO65]